MLLLPFRIFSLRLVFAFVFVCSVEHLWLGEFDLHYEFIYLGKGTVPKCLIVADCSEVYVETTDDHVLE